MTAPGHALRVDEDRETLQRAARADSYGLVLVLTLAVFMLPAVVPDDQPWRSIIIGLACLSVLVSLHTSRVTVWFFWVAAVLAALTTTQSIFEVDLLDADGSVAIAIGFLLIAAPVAILNRIARHRQVTIRTLLGAIDVYLQIGIAFSFIFQAADHFNESALVAVEASDRAAFGYFSFVTLATLGYGDIVPATPVARNLAVIETIIGQVFLVVVVARVVTMLGARRTVDEPDRRRRTGAERDA